MEWRSLWASRGSEGGPVAVVAVDGGDELRSVAACEKQRRGEGARRVRWVGGLRGVADGVQGDERKAASRRWPGHRQRSPPSSFGARGRKTTERRRWAGPLEELGQVSGRQVSVR